MINIQYNTYGDPIYDTKYFEIKMIRDLDLGDMIWYQDNPCKITKISKKKHLRWIYITNIFTDDKNETVCLETQDILIPKIIIHTYEFMTMTNTLIQLFNEDTNDIVEIMVDLKIDKNIIEKINGTILTQIEFKVKTIEFKNLIRITEIY